jgi:glycosyltransferase involved in cell wall biosynthesis
MPGWGAGDVGRAVAVARSGGFDLVHMQYPSVSYGRGPAVNLLPGLLRLRAGVPVVVTIHDFRVMRKRWCARVVPMLTFASALIHVDGGDGPHLRRWSPLRHAPMTHIPIASNAPVVPCDDDRRRALRRDLGLADDEFAVAHFGILYPHKGVDELLEAASILRGAGRRVRPVVVGDFDRSADYVEPMSRRLCGAGVVWVRGASLERVSECLHACDAAALPFHSGASFNRSSMLACLQHGLPTVTTNGPATPASLAEAFDLLFVPVNDPPAIAASLSSLMDDAALRQRLRVSALAASDKLSWPAVAGRHIEFYREVVARHRGGVVAALPAREGAA